MATIRYKYMGGRYVMAAVATGVIVLMGVVPGKAFEGNVERVIDGDTVVVGMEQGPVTVRLWGVDAPENDQPYGASASDFVRVMCEGRPVVVTVRDVDGYGRTVGEVKLKDGRKIGDELLRAGLAWWEKQYAPRDNVKAELEREAVEARRGLWGGSMQVPPWVWRKK